MKQNYLAQQVIGLILLLMSIYGHFLGWIKISDYLVGIKIKGITHFYGKIGLIILLVVFLLHLFTIIKHNKARILIKVSEIFLVIISSFFIVLFYKYYSNINAADFIMKYGVYNMNLRIDFGIYLICISNLFFIILNLLTLKSKG